LGLQDPQLAVIGIRADGSFYLIQTLNLTIYSDIGSPYRIRYTPDGRHLLLLSSEEHYLISYAVDANTGALSWADSIYETDWLPPGYIVDALAITPDSRFVVLPNMHFPTQTECTFMVYEIGADGSLTRITQTRNDFPGYVSDMDFIPPYREPVTAVSTGWMLYQ
jgi:6-phosphogluconolactonase (cycloisomerase 2 family)